MRLLNKTTLQLEWFSDEQAPPYNILSHRWRGLETSLQEFEAQRQASEPSPGTAKVLRFCHEVASYNADYVWVDTVCIDKSSSAELQEAINSMYRWYERADMCIVYLDDVTVDQTAGMDSIKDGLSQSEWFARGWCLQELLSPRQQKFLNRDWGLIGKRKKLGGIIEEITGVRQDFYGDSAKIRSASVAERMSWISLRKTSRPEDLAYCMLGVFDVNMTMLYGEGHKAFLRLQKEIIQAIDDESIFMWLHSDASSQEHLQGLAPSPASFAACRNRKIELDIYFHREPPRTTIKGIEFEIYGGRNDQFEDEKNIALNCLLDGKRAYLPLIRGTSQDKQVNKWRRKPENEILSVPVDEVERPPTTKSAYEKELWKIERVNHDFGRERSKQAEAWEKGIEFRDQQIRHKIFIY